MEFGKIESIQKLGCPHCNKPISDIDAESLMEDNRINCPNCLMPIKLPDRVIQELQKRSYLGKNIDISC